MSVNDKQLRDWLNEYGKTYQVEIEGWRTRSAESGCTVFGISSAEDAVGLTRFLGGKAGCESQTKRDVDGVSWVVLCHFVPTRSTPASELNS